MTVFLKSHRLPNGIRFELKSWGLSEDRQILKSPEGIEITLEASAHEVVEGENCAIVVLDTHRYDNVLAIE